MASPIRARRVRYVSGALSDPEVEDNADSPSSKSDKFMAGSPTKLDKRLRIRSASLSSIAVARGVGNSTFVVELWELQRRATLFHTTWLAPFLPHDGPKQYRWVDTQYHKHPWNTRKKRTSALYEVPPIIPPNGWRCNDAGWKVQVTPGGICDEDGWQYAVDFYGPDIWWGNDPALFHCRRRLWKCIFVRTPAAEDQGLKKSGNQLGHLAHLARSPRPRSPQAENMTTVATGCVPSFSLALEAEHLLNEEWKQGNLIVDLLRALGATEIEVGPCFQDDGAAVTDTQNDCFKTRWVSMRIPDPFQSKTNMTTRATAKYSVSVEHQKGPVSICINAKILMHEIPDGNDFCIQERTILALSSDSVSVTKSFGVLFSKHTSKQLMIMSQIRIAQQEQSNILLAFLRQRALGSEQEESDTCTVQVCELQRRLTLFHTEWQAPFLPHDGQKGWRWVDKQYRKHEWAAGTQESSAVSDVPSITPPKGWKCSGTGWVVTKPPGPCCEDGWQYCIEFAIPDVLWGDVPAVCHCRRRFWKCTFTRSPQGVAAIKEQESPKKCIEPCQDDSQRTSTQSSPVKNQNSSLQMLAIDKMTTVVEENVPSLSLHVEACHLLADEWGPGNLIMDLLKAQGVTEIEVGPWLREGQDDEGQDANVVVEGVTHGSAGSNNGHRRIGTRRITMRVPVPPAPLAPKTTRCVVTYRVTVDEGLEQAGLISIEAEFHMLDIPYCDCFYVQERILLTCSADNAKVTKAFGIIFKRSVFVRAAIECSTKSSQMKAGEHTVGFLRQRGAMVDEEANRQEENRSGSDPSQEQNCLEVWELQRRITLFHKSWHAPFLPHDGQKQWRWVDKQFQKHCWTKGSLKAAGLSDIPPVENPRRAQSMRADGSSAGVWAVANPPGPHDSEGWQYSVEFHNIDALWGKNAALCHCRRRLWIFSPKEKQSLQVMDKPYSSMPHKLDQGGGFFTALASLLLACMLSVATMATGLDKWAVYSSSLRGANPVAAIGLIVIFAALCILRGARVAAFKLPEARESGQLDSVYRTVNK